MRLRLEIPCVRQRLAPLLGEIDRALVAESIDGGLREDVRLIAEEVVCNAIDYGGEEGNDQPHQMTVDIARKGDGLHVEFRDDGRAFDPLAQDVPDLDADIIERPIGGLGVHLVRELAHSVRYRREGPYNVLQVELRRR